MLNPYADFDFFWFELYICWPHWHRSVSIDSDDCFNALSVEMPILAAFTS